MEKNKKIDDKKEELRLMRLEIKALRDREKYHRIYMNRINRNIIEKEKKYKIEYASYDWGNKFGKFFHVKGFEDEDFYCHVFERKEGEPIRIEVFEEASGNLDTFEVTDPSEDSGYRSWTEITEEEYNKKKTLEDEEEISE